MRTLLIVRGRRLGCRTGRYILRYSDELLRRIVGGIIGGLLLTWNGRLGYHNPYSISRITFLLMIPKANMVEADVWPFS